MKNASRDMHLSFITNALAHKSFTDGGFDGNLPLAQVSLVRIDDGIGSTSAGSKIGDLYLAEKTCYLTLELRSVKHTRKLKDILLETDLAEKLAVFAFGSVILEVLAEIALSTGLDKSSLDLWEFDIDEMIDFSYELVVAFLRHIFHLV